MLMKTIVKSSSGSKLFVCVSIILIVSFATFNWIVFPQLSYLKAAERYEWMAGSAGQKSNIIKKGIDVKKEELGKLETEISRIQNSFFNEINAKEFLSNLEPTAMQSNCNIDSLVFLPAETIVSKAGIGNTSSIILKRAEVSLAGGYDDIISFIEKLSSHPQRVSIGNLLIQSDHFNKKELVCFMTVAIYLIEDKETVTNE